jgi:hypothetical protein
MPGALAGPIVRTSVVAVSLTMALAVGCSKPQSGPARIAVTGKVTFDGQPVPRGTIAFEPDSLAGNSGPGGYGTIVDGRFTTHPQMGPVGGAQKVRIAGFDGKATAELIDGKPLFPEYTTTVELPTKATTIDFDVPRAASPRKATPPGQPASR